MPLTSVPKPSAHPSSIEDCLDHSGKHCPHRRNSSTVGRRVEVRIPRRHRIGAMLASGVGVGWGLKSRLYVVRCFLS